jgi:hypothetical protein
VRAPVSARPRRPAGAARSARPGRAAAAPLSDLAAVAARPAFFLRARHGVYPAGA